MLENINIEQYDIIHAQDRFTANVMGRLNENYKKPLLFTPHGFMTHNRLRFNLIKSGSVEEAYYFAIDRKAITAANQVIILCEIFRPILKKLGAEDEKMTTVYTGIDFQAQEIKPNTEKTVITCVSRLRPRKGHKYLLEAFSLIKNQFTNVELRIVGDGEMREELEKQARELQLNNVVFLGRRTDIAELLSQSDIFVLPTTSDTLPISVIEAMLAGQAIITTYCGGIPEIIQDQQTGLIVNPADSKQLAEKLQQLLQDETLRRNLADNARSFAQNHLTISNMVTKIEQVYFSLLSKEEL
jgi:glycosyltransferase involved in cell wall biosynthesis